MIIRVYHDTTQLHRLYKVALNVFRTMVNGESGDIWKEKTVAYFKSMSTQSPVVTEKRREKLQPW